jgi:hypothetical protein
MLGQSPIENVLGSRAAGDKSNLGAYVRALADAGLAVVFVDPASKKPLDLRTTHARRKDDAAAQAAALERGDPNYLRAESDAGVYLATTDRTRLDSYVKQAAKAYGEDRVNLGVEVGRSRLLIVDVDTEAEVETFARDWAAATGETYRPLTPTVSSPGKVKIDTDGVEDWVHKGGGHFWFTLPDDMPLPEGGTGAYKAPGGNGWIAYWANRQILIPPSVRTEGPYIWNGPVRPLPGWIYDRIMSQTNERKAKAAARIESGVDSPIDAWAAGTKWSTLLEPDGWTNTGVIDTCGCEIWTAPGPHDSPKSATAHDLGCSLDHYDGSGGHAPLHLWTDNPPDGLARYVNARGTQTLSRLQYVAWTHHDGNEGEAAKALDIPMSEGIREAGAFDYVDPSEFLFGEAMEQDKAAATEQAVAAGVDSFSVPPSTEVAEHEAATTVAQDFWLTKAGPFDMFRDIPEPEYLIENYLDEGGFSLIVGEPGAGKSFLTLDMVASIASGVTWQGRPTKQHKVGYVVGEGLPGFTRRIKAWETAHETNLGQSVYLVAEPVQVTDEAMWVGLGKWAKQNELRVLVLDTLNRVTVGVEENSAKEMSHVVNRVNQLMAYTGCAVIIVHHTTRDTDHGRGSTALEGAVDTVLLVRPDLNSDNGFTLEMTKQKNHEAVDVIELSRVPVEGTGSAVIGNVNGKIATTTDPFELVPTPEISPTERVAILVDCVNNSPGIGITKAELRRMARPRFTRKGLLDDNTFGKVFLAALDAAVQAGYLAGANGQAPSSAARFVNGPAPCDIKLPD